jgi:hypothetical protein
LVCCGAPLLVLAVVSLGPALIAFGRSGERLAIGLGVALVLALVGGLARKRRFATRRRIGSVGRTSGPPPGGG